eukprot:jgi/Mesvir1/12230/Mv00452-RA.1
MAQCACQAVGNAVYSGSTSKSAVRSLPTAAQSSHPQPNAGLRSWPRRAWLQGRAKDVGTLDSYGRKSLRKNSQKTVMMAAAESMSARGTEKSVPDKAPASGSKGASSATKPADGQATTTAQERIRNMVVAHAAEIMQDLQNGAMPMQALPTYDPAHQAMLDRAYERCGIVCAEYAKTFYLGTKLMTPERQRAVWAIYVWCRRTDELVDGPNAPRITPVALDRWEERLEEIFAGHPYDLLDAALSDTVRRYPVDIQPFRDMVNGMRMDLVKSRYDNFDELYEYCYNVAGTVGLMTTPVMGLSKKPQATTEEIYEAALALGLANQLTNILRDVGEDYVRGRIYLPLDELAKYELTEEDIARGVVTDKWREFMKFQIKRARWYFKQAEFGASQLAEESRYPVFAALNLYRQILDSIEANDYDNFSKRAYVSRTKKLLGLPLAYLSAKVLPPPPRPEPFATASFS